MRRSCSDFEIFSMILVGFRVGRGGLGMGGRGKRGFGPSRAREHGFEPKI